MLVALTVLNYSWWVTKAFQPSLNRAQLKHGSPVISPKKCKGVVFPRNFFVCTVHYQFSLGLT